MAFGWVKDLWDWATSTVENQVSSLFDNPKCLPFKGTIDFWRVVAGIAFARKAGVLTSREQCFNAATEVSGLQVPMVPPALLKLYGDCACRAVFDHNIEAPSQIGDEIAAAKLTPVGYSASPLVAWSPGHLDMLACFGDGTIRNKSWDVSTGEWWPGQTEWADLGGDCTGPAVMCAWGPGHLDVVARFKDGTIRNKVWDVSTGEWWPGQTEWANLGGDCVGTPAIFAWGPGHLDVVARFADGTIRSKAWDASPGEWWPGQTEWADLGGNCVGSPAIFAWGPDHLDVMARFKDGVIRNKVWDASTGEWWPGQTEWADLGGG